MLTFLGSIGILRMRADDGASSRGLSCEGTAGDVLGGGNISTLSVANEIRDSSRSSLLLVVDNDIDTDISIYVFLTATTTTAIPVLHLPFLGGYNYHCNTGTTVTLPLASCTTLVRTWCLYPTRAIRSHTVHCVAVSFQVKAGPHLTDVISLRVLPAVPFEHQQYAPYSVAMNKKHMGSLNRTTHKGICSTSSSRSTGLAATSTTQLNGFRTNTHTHRPP